MKNFITSLMLLSSFNIFAADPLFDQQWGLKNSGQKIYRAEGEIRREQVEGIQGADIDWPGLAELSKLEKDREVVVAVIDSGIDMLHPDLADRVFVGKDFLDDAEMKDDTGHGTHVAGIIAANANAVGVTGVTPQSIKILPLKVLNKNTTGFVYKGRVITDIIADALAFAVESKVDVINMSLGWPKVVNTPKIVRALDIAAKNNIVLIAASGNNNKDVPTWPCAHPAVICVGAMDNQGKVSEFSNHGGKVDLVAPGEWIVSSIPRALESRTLRISGYEAKNGSSQAAPFVAAAAALLKLQNPNISAAQIKAKLYASARPMTQIEDNRFVRFGALSIKGALAQNDISMASVLVKELVSVDVDSAGEFSFELPIEILGDKSQELDIQVEGLNVATIIDNDKLLVSGKLDSLRIDSEVPLTFITKLGATKTRTSMTISFARKLSQNDLVSSTIEGIPASALAVINGSRKMSRMEVVSIDSTPSSDFHGYIQGKSGDKIRAISIRANAGDEKAKLTSVTLEDHHQLLAVFERDVNFDGKNDLVFYGMSARRDQLILSFTDMDGQALFGENSRWELPISTFEGLPLKDGERSDFSWVKLKTFLGELSVPLYQKAWMLPLEDNSNDLLDHEPASMAPRVYYLEPIKQDNKVVIRPRVIDSVSFKQELQAQLTTMPWENAVIERTLPQSDLEREKGIVRQVISVGEDFYRRFHILTVNQIGSHKIEAHADSDVFQVGNMSLVTRKLNDFTVSENSFQMALLDRSSARVKPFITGKTSEAWTLLTSGWSNPFFEVVATFEGQNRRTLFFESRYHVYVYDQQGDGVPVSARLPINRDSSFPGVNFSETLQSAVVKVNGRKSPAVAVNSTLIYGDRLYAMLADQQKLVRPVALSVNIPANCVPLKTQFLTNSQGVSAYAMLCQSSANQVDLSFFPLELN